MDNHADHKHGHFILPDKLAFAIGGTLLVLTFITVVVAQINLGWANFPVAMLVATIKGSLVALFFMGLKYDKKENAVIFLTSLLFAVIFMVLTATDLFWRPTGIYTNGQVAVVGSTGKAQFKQPWVTKPEMISHGKELFMVQCVACHGPEGKGDGPAAAALDPKPRNFTAATGWKNGRKVSKVFQTLTKGLNKMPSFGSLPAEDRWSLAHYVLSLGPPPEKDSSEDLKLAGVDPTKPDGGLGGGEQMIPIDFAIELMSEDGSVKKSQK